VHAAIHQPSSESLPDLWATYLAELGTAEFVAEYNLVNAEGVDLAEMSDLGPLLSANVHETRAAAEMPTKSQALSAASGRLPKRRAA
jgi:hypothetical protein